MSAKILNGKLLAQNLENALKKEVASLKKETGCVPHLVNVMVGDHHGACAYAKSQKKAAEHISIQYELEALQEDVTQEHFRQCIKRLNDDESVNGIMIHKPVPQHIEYHAVAKYVDTDKDLEGINVTNIGKMLLGETRIIPCTPASVMEHIKSTGIDLYGKEAVIVGHSVIVGKPLSLLLLEQFATVTVCHIATSEAGQLEAHVRRADIVVVAVGKPSVIKGDWIKKGAVVIDVGINQVNDKIVGDVEFEAACKNAAFITPVPGGVGPVTVTMLMRNGVEAFKAQMRKKGKL
ncbi:MAG: bifunctional 5,10-methylenetetrahydrofolate dehydrogenase/5,10-methenyltetrahydrofolate cyclohydrolase [Candidatus Omnitrophica bacterium]|nr:bifunctional 5,10-methylenetetrahydrofolate dehydrogenase/5,10-methenyltetrahydrofolate cyclohydrolase [Candidatus Omnitrophota bacterium]